MTHDVSIDEWQDMLRRLHPVDCLVHVGVGHGSALTAYASWGLTKVMLIEADADQLPALRRAVGDHSGWEVCEALVSDRAENRSFHLYSNPRESGLLPLDELLPAWRNLKLRETRVLVGSRLADVLPAKRAEDANWLVIDCMPAAQVLAGAGQVLEQLDVIRVRVGLGDGWRAGSGAGRHDVDVLLQARGFVEVCSEEENHSAIGQTLYARQWKASAVSLMDVRRALEAAAHQQATALTAQAAEAASLRERLIDVERTLKASLADVEMREKAATEQASLAAERLALLDSVTSERDQHARLVSEQVLQIDQLRAQLDEMVHAHDLHAVAKNEHAAMLAQRQAELEALRSERDRQAVLVAECRVQLEALTAERDELTRKLADQVEAKEWQAVQTRQHLSELERLELECNRQSKLAAELQAQVESLSRQRDEATLARDAHARAKDEQAVLYAQRLDELEKLRAERDQQARLAVERQSQLESMARLRDDLAAAKDACSKTCDELSQQLRAEQSARQESGDELARLQRHQSLLRIEFYKASAQLELMKDVLLRGKRF